MALVMPRVESTVYDGTNGQVLASEWLEDATLVSDDGETLVIDTSGWPDPVRREIPRGSFVLRHYGRIFKEALEPEEYAKRWAEVPDPAP
ncbi:hypothetical protein HHX38_08335 [Streptomyces sp. PKU-MA01144]|uniref:hypothetical protein n=1 Tax=Streptomyces sp. PKU-MA01144 TaxID=2729138 RepID=UPI00147AF2D9|nr:hypothetical protein [Streptomyces sp. PKU-MA01144]NNJ04141.1 hypothetical protein [Streptomyces sp. PKU-MA01144]